MGRDQAPVLDAKDGITPIDQDCGQPQGDLCTSADQRPYEQQPDREGGADGQRVDRTSETRLAAAGLEINGDMPETHNAVGNSETECSIAESLGEW